MAEMETTDEKLTPTEPGQEKKEDVQTMGTLETLKKIGKNVSEDDTMPTGTVTLRKVLGGDILSTELVRRQVWLFLLIVVFIVVSVAFRYQCQQDMIQIDKLEKDLKDARYKALESASTLTEKCRESHVLNILRANQDSTLHTSDQPPFIINTEE